VNIRLFFRLSDGVPAALLALVACAGPGGGGGGAGGDSAYSRSGEIKIGRFSRVHDPLRKAEVVTYRVFLSQTWQERRGAKPDDPFSRAEFPAVAPVEDWAMAAFLEQLGRNGLFTLPRRFSVAPEDLLGAADRKVDALTVETDAIPPFHVFLGDCRLAAQVKAYLDCLKDFEKMADANRPAKIGIAIQPMRTLTDFPAGPIVEPAPTVQPKKARIVPPRTRTEARPDAESSPKEKRPPVSPPPAQK
jgi:hypothetical protein